MKYQAIDAGRDHYPVRLMCRCLKVSHSGYYDWHKRQPSLRSRDNQRLLGRIRSIHVDHQGVIGRRRMHEELGYAGETASINRIGRLMRSHGMYGIPVAKAWRYKPSGLRPVSVANHLKRDFVALEPNTKWVTDIVRHEAPCKRAEVKDLRLLAVAAAGKKLRAARPWRCRDRVESSPDNAVTGWHC